MASRAEQNPSNRNFFKKSFCCYRHAEDYKVWLVRADEVYTETERIENYAQAFADRPRGYDGDWDYKFVNEHRADIFAGYLKAHLVDGEIIWKRF